MLVVVGILAVLVALLAPSLGRVREQARRATCLANVRMLTTAALTYAAANDRVLPDAAGVNSPLESPLCPRSTTLPPWTPYPAFGPGACVLPGIGGPLQPYLPADGRPWGCPSAPPEAFVLQGPDPYGGTLAPNQFKTNYNYMAGKEFFRDAKNGGPIVAPFKLREWVTRNVAGLPVERAVPVGQSTADVVLFHDRVSTYHSPDQADIYRSTKDARYYASFGDLDGRAEGHQYTNVNGYFAQIHHAVRQNWYGADFAQVFPEQYGQ